MNIKDWVVRNFDLTPHLGDKSGFFGACLSGVITFCAGYIAYLMVFGAGSFGIVLHVILSILTVGMLLCALLMTVALVLAALWSPVRSRRVLILDIVRSDEERPQ